MKKTIFSLILILVLGFGAFALTGCNNVKNNNLTFENYQKIVNTNYLNPYTNPSLDPEKYTISVLGAPNNSIYEINEDNKIVITLIYANHKNPEEATKIATFKFVDDVLVYKTQKGLR